MKHPPYTSWKALEQRAEALRERRMTTLFSHDPTRAADFACEAAGIYLDYSKNLIDRETLKLFDRLSEEAQISERRSQMFGGERINLTEDRAALHTLLRANQNDAPVSLAAESTDVLAALRQMKLIAEQIRSGEWRGCSGKQIRHLVHIGIGGSFLGPYMLDEALKGQYPSQISCDYIANVDAHHLLGVLDALNPEETLVIVVSKTFTTLETMTNAHTARKWLLTSVPESQLNRHLAAVSSNIEAASAFGIDRANILPIWDWVGGRYSLWSVVSLPIAIRFGYDVFETLLEGARLMDDHFISAPTAANMPLMLAWLEIWYQHFFGAESHAVLTYDHRLRLLPDHLQQLDMESNGKSTRMDGGQVNYPTGAVIWGGEGTNGQHAFHQLLHQGTRYVPIDFILPLRPDHDHLDHHHKLVASCLSQAQALMLGRAESELDDSNKLVRKHRVMPGNRPSNMLLLDRLSASTLGALVALYEHKVFCQAMIWQINPFDQWGVELGKELGSKILTLIESGGESIDPSTDSLLGRYRQSLGN